MSLMGARAELADTLRVSGYPVHDHVPDQIEPPCIVIAPADGYVGGGQTFTEVTVQLDVWCLVPLGGDNEVTANDLDRLLTQAMNNLDDWMPTACGQPGVFETANWEAHGVNITVANQTTITTTL